MEVRQRVAQKIKALRGAQGISQEELADRAGLHRTYISGVERAVRNPTLTVLEKIARALRTPLSDIVAEG
jgi:transcriptional regulator with XRE-family HTH domain